MKLPDLGKDRVRLVHISDLHISENLFETDQSRRLLPHRYGHRDAAFKLLDFCLRSMDFDVLVASGDLTRVGSRDSLNHVRDWLIRPPVPGGNSLGLDLNTRNKAHVVVPGNHDRFGGSATQSEGLDAYSTFFGSFHLDRHPDPALNIRGHRIVFHRFDSSWRHGVFGQGRVDEAFLVPWRRQGNDVHVAVSHHHCLVPNEVRTKRNQEMVNSKDFLDHMLAFDFAAVLYGHTHRGYFSILPAKAALELSKHVDKRTCLRRRRYGVIKKLITLLSPQNEPCHFDVAPCKNRKYIAMDARIDYHYYKVVDKFDIKGPEGFSKPADYYAYLDEISATHGKKRITSVDILDKRRIAFSMAPSSCQLEVPEDDLGFHVLDFVFGESGSLEDVVCFPYRYDKTGFVPWPDKYEDVRSMRGPRDWGANPRE